MLKPKKGTRGWGWTGLTNPKIVASGSPLIRQGIVASLIFHIGFRLDKCD